MFNDLKTFIADIAEGSGKIIKQYYRQPFQIETKTDASPVTIADKKAEEYIRERIMTAFPDHGIIGEEFGTHNPDAEFLWVIDPIDGTKSFICGVPLFGTLIALKQKDNIVLGAFNQPILGEFLIGDGTITKLNNTTVKMRTCEKLNDAFLLSTDQLNIEKYQDIDRFNYLTHNVKLYRTWGDCYGYYLLATGYADIMIDPVMNPWDSYALIPIIRGAGGVITDYHGNDPISGDSIIAAGPELHGRIVSILSE